MILFNEYVDRHQFMSKKNLRLLAKVLEKDGLEVEDFTHDTPDPYIFVYAFPKAITYLGVRFFMHGDILAFKTQKKPETQPYGESYELDLQTMLVDIYENEDDKSEKNITKVLIQLIGKEIRNHFKKAKKAEEEILSGQLASSKDAMGQITIRNAGTDYANTVLSKWN